MGPASPGADDDLLEDRGQRPVHVTLIEEGVPEGEAKPISLRIAKTRRRSVSTLTVPESAATSRIGHAARTRPVPGHRALLRTCVGESEVEWTQGVLQGRWRLLPWQAIDGLN